MESQRIILEGLAHLRPVIRVPSEESVSGCAMSTAESVPNGNFPALSDPSVPAAPGAADHA